MERIERNNAKNLYELARNGNKFAYDKIINLCLPLITDKAIQSYNMIKQIFYNQYNKEISNNVLDLDDVIQDLRVKSCDLLYQYLLSNNNYYFSSYLSHMLSSYIKSYSKSKIKDLLNKENNEVYQDIDCQHNICFSNIDDTNKREIIDTIQYDKKLSKYIPFINAIFEGKTYDEVSRLINVDSRRIGLKIDMFSEYYKQLVNKNKLLSLKEYINSGNIISDIRNGNLFEMPYLKKEIIFTLHDIYHELLSKFNVSYKLIKEDFCFMLSSYLEKKINQLSNIEDIENYFINILKSIKKAYLSFKELYLQDVVLGNWNNYIFDNNTIGEEDIYKIIENGDIYLLSPYREYIDIIIQKVYKKLIENINIDFNRVNMDMILSINGFVDKNKILLYLDLNAFNHDFRDYLRKKTKKYTTHKIEKTKKI